MFDLYDTIPGSEIDGDFFSATICNCSHDSCSCLGTCACDEDPYYEHGYAFTAPSEGLQNRTNASSVFNVRH